MTQPSTNRGRVTFTLVDAVATSKAKRLSESWIVWADRVSRQQPTYAATKEERDSSSTYPLISGANLLMLEEDARTQDWMLPNGNPAYSRSDANVIAVEALILDFDNDPKNDPTPVTLQQLKDRLAGLEFVYWTSWSHGSNKYGDSKLDMFRIVLPLRTPVSPEEYKERTDALEELFPEADKAFKRLSQPYYLPVVHPDRADLYQAGWENTGLWLDLLELPVNQRPEPKVVQPGTFTITDQVLPSAEETWIKLADGRELTAAALYHSMADGDKHTTYRVGDPNDRKPGAFLYRRGSGLICYNENGSKNRFIHVVKTIRTGPVDDGDSKLVLKVKTKTPTEPREQITLDAIQPAPLVPIDGTPFMADGALVHELNDRYLPDTVNDLIPEQGVLVIQSPKGTGKTERLKDLVRQCDRDGHSVMLLGHRVFLLENLSVRTGLEFYRDLETGTLTRDVAVCMNSLATRYNRKDGAYHTIIIDESEQVLQALTSKTLERDLSKVFNNLLFLLQSAKRIVCLDADLTASLTISLLKFMRGENPSDDCLGVINRYRIGEGQTTKQYLDKYHLIGDALGDIAAGEKVFIATNNKRQAKDLHGIITTLLEKKSLLVSADTAEGPDQQAFIQSPSTEQFKYDVVIATPTLSTGISIDQPYFTRVYGLFGLNPGTFQDADQAVSRVRACTDIRVWLQDNREEPSIPSEDTIRTAAIEREVGTRKRLPDESVDITEGELLWADVYARIKRMVALWSNDKPAQFVQLRQRLGYTIQPIAPNKAIIDSTRELLASFEPEPDTYAEDVFNAEPLTPDEYDELNRKRQKTREEHLRIERHRYKFELKEAFDLDTLKRAIAEGMLKRLSRVKVLVLADDGYRESADIEERAANRSTFTTNKHRVQQADLLQYLSKVGVVDIEGLQAQAASIAAGAAGEIEVPQEQLEQVGRAFAARAKDFNLYFNLRFKDPDDPQNLKLIWNRVFGEHTSLPLKKVRRGSRDNRVSKYIIDVQAAALTLQQLQKLRDRSS